MRCFWQAISKRKTSIIRHRRGKSNSSIVNSFWGFYKELSFRFNIKRVTYKISDLVMRDDDQLKRSLAKIGLRLVFNKNTGKFAVKEDK